MDTRGGGQAADDRRIVKDEDYMSDEDGALGQDHDMHMPQQQPQQHVQEQLHQQPQQQQQQQQTFAQQQQQQQQQAAPQQQGYQDRSRASTPGRHSASLVRPELDQRLTMQ